jgi:hypothetical protein
MCSICYGPKQKTRVEKRTSLFSVRPAPEFILFITRPARSWERSRSPGPQLSPQAPRVGLFLFPLDTTKYDSLFLIRRRTLATSPPGSWLLSATERPIALPPYSNGSSAMRQQRLRLKQLKFFEQRLAEDAKQLREEAKLLPPGAMRDATLRKPSSSQSRHICGNVSLGSARAIRTSPGKAHTPAPAGRPARLARPAINQRQTSRRDSRRDLSRMANKVEAF